ncbi:MAG TPA: ATP-binding protein, partial [Atribacterota bacterium]|nr:ATP-binding protein [Atribacterota bacterium]
LLVFGTEDLLMEAITNYRIEYLEISGISYEDAPTRYSFRISSEQNLWTTFFDIYERFPKKIDIPFKMVTAGFRDDNPEHLQALREALVNLIIHTDYFSRANPRIRVFSDRFEFFNPGSLPKKIEYILEEDFSLPRNPIIAKIFRFVRLAESIGSGFHKMIDGWEQHYGLEPVIEGDFDYYKITFPITTTQKTTQKIIALIGKSPEISRKELAEVIGLTEDGIKYHLKKMQEKGILKRIGPAKGGYWEVVEK